jgi:hypothetical protein
MRYIVGDGSKAWRESYIAVILGLMVMLEVREALTNRA